MKTDSTLCQQNLLKIQPFSHITEPIEFVNRFSFKKLHTLTLGVVKVKTYPLREWGRRRDGTDSTDSRRYGAISDFAV